jgi:hypothetical protein
MGAAIGSILRHRSVGIRDGRPSGDDRSEGSGTSVIPRSGQRRLRALGSSVLATSTTRERVEPFVPDVIARQHNDPANDTIL